MNQLEEVTVEINAPVEKVWKYWKTPGDIMEWNIPFLNWHSPRVENDLKTGGEFAFYMEAKDGSEGFDHKGKYDEVIENKLIEYTTDDGRKSIIRFKSDGEKTTVSENFQPEKQTPLHIQKEFVQEVLNRFKNYVETKE